MNGDRDLLSRWDEGTRSRAAFRGYTEHYRLSRQEVAQAAQVRLVTVWNIEQGIPVRESHAIAVRSALSTLSGVPYTALIATVPQEIMTMVRRPR